MEYKNINDKIKVAVMDLKCVRQSKYCKGNGENMVKKIKLELSEDLREFMELAWHFNGDVGVHSGNSIADAKSILGLIALDYSQPVQVVT
ncbi:MAG: HPr family phosphocarrier protein, partial [Clostridiales bacterium]|nr:HPr family phosphocarrier protein [Clostridiales bacterium]